MQILGPCPAALHTSRYSAGQTQVKACETDIIAGFVFQQDGTETWEGERHEGLGAGNLCNPVVRDSSFLLPRAYGQSLVRDQEPASCAATKPGCFSTLQAEPSLGPSPPFYIQCLSMLSPSTTGQGSWLCAAQKSNFNKAVAQCKEVINLLEGYQVDFRVGDQEPDLGMELTRHSNSAATATGADEVTLGALPLHLYDGAL